MSCTSTYIKLVSDDTEPPLLIQLFDENTGLPVDLSLATKIVKCKFRRRGTTTVLFTATCTKVDAPSGQVRMAWPTGGLAVDPGVYEVEVYIEDGTDVQSAYETIKCKIRSDF